MFEEKFLLGVGITSATEEEILEYILQSLKKTAEKYYIVTPNPEILVYASKHKDFQAILNNARLALCDGIGIFWAGKLLGKNFKQRITGVDLMENLCKAASKQPITVGFLGGGEKIAERTAECLVRKYPGLKVGFVGSKWLKEGFALRSPRQFGDLPTQNPNVSPVHSQASQSFNEASVVPIQDSPHAEAPRAIPHSNSQLSTLNSQLSLDILFVAFGFPKQEEWMAKNIAKVPVRIMVGVGGAFDYISGNIHRAPLLIRSIGFEWFYRLIAQPWRWRRQLALLEFVWLVFKEKLIKE